MSFIKSSVTDTLCDLLCINELFCSVFLCLLVRHHLSSYLSNYGQHSTNTSIWLIRNQSQHDGEALNNNKGLSSTLLHGSVDQCILTIWRSVVPDNVAVVGRRIYGEEEEMNSIFYVLINRPIEIDLGNNGNDHRKKLETKHAKPKLFTTT